MRLIFTLRQMYRFRINNPKSYLAADTYLAIKSLPENIYHFFVTIKYLYFYFNVIQFFLRIDAK